MFDDNSGKKTINLLIHTVNYKSDSMIRIKGWPKQRNMDDNNTKFIIIINPVLLSLNFNPLTKEHQMGWTTIQTKTT